MTPPSLACFPLPDFDPADLESVSGAFAEVPAIQMGQAWRPQPEAGFLPAEVRAGRSGNQLVVFGTLPDLDIFTLATAPNQKTWQLGDVFEIFLKSEDRPRYHELHVTPANLRTQLRFPPKESGLEFLPDGIFESRVWIESGRWHVLATIPGALITGLSAIAPGERWRFSFCRYDAFRDGREPVISSTSPHPVPAFHRPAEWGVMVF